MIKLEELSKEDIGSKVTYIPPHANGRIRHLDCEEGIISSWNEFYIFVNYGGGHGQATRPEDLVWG